MQDESELRGSCHCGAVTFAVKGRPLRAVITALAGAAFVWLTSSSLPAVVASHFGADGLPDGFAPRPAYVRLMLGLVVVTPLVARAVAALAGAGGGMLLNMPNKRYWLEPQRRHETLAYIRTRLTRVADALFLFLCYAHWLVVHANTQVPVKLSSRALTAGIALLGTFAVFTVLSLHRHFVRAPGAALEPTRPRDTHRET